MSIYVMSDIHGCFDEFMCMLKKIKYKESDTLILAGDYIDRGQQNIEMLQWLERRGDNVVCIKGNHDEEFRVNVNMMVLLDKKEELGTDGNSNEDAGVLYDSMKYMLKGYENNAAMYFDAYGGIRQMIGRGATLNELICWADMIQKMPYVYEIDVTDRHYIIVHAGYIEDLKPISEDYSDIKTFYLYAREEGYRYGGKEHCTIIAGHTPTVIQGEFTYNSGEVFKYYNRENDCTFYDIDCGCVLRNENSNAALACMRLEDETIYYV